MKMVTATGWLACERRRISGGRFSGTPEVRLRSQATGWPDAMNNSELKHARF